MEHPDWASIDVDEQALAAVEYIRELIPDVPEPDNLSTGLAYPIAANTAWFLRDALSKGDTEYFRPLFDRVEDLVIHGTWRVRNLVVIGLLEDLQNATLQADLSLDMWKHWLGRHSLAMWAAVNDFWNGDHKALERAERQTGLAFLEKY